MKFKFEKVGKCLKCNKDAYILLNDNTRYCYSHGRQEVLKTIKLSRLTQMVKVTYYDNHGIYNVTIPYANNKATICFEFFKMGYGLLTIRQANSLYL